MERCRCEACRDFVNLCWTRLAGGVWVLSICEQLFATPSLLVAVDSAGEAIWFVDSIEEVRSNG